MQVEKFKMCIRDSLGTTNAGTYLLAGIFYYDLEKYDEAYKYFDRCV